MSQLKPALAAAAVLAGLFLAQTPASAQATGKLALPIKDATGKAMTGDLASGRKIFRQCETCHVTTIGVNKVGPSLHGIIGRHSGTVPNFRYSAANKKSGITWTPQELFVYLENPQKRIPGTFMSFTGVKNPQQRADVIAYLIANTK